MDQEQIDQEQSDNDFNAGFNSVRSPDDYVPSEEKKEPVVEAPVEAEAQEPAKEEPDEEPLFAGMTESQIKSLLERSARVDSIEEQLRKAHGKIGELNGTLQEIKTRQSQPTPKEAPAVAPEVVSDFERDFPEFATFAEAKARRIAEEMLQNTPPAVPAEDIRSQLQQEMQLGIMDAIYPDWRETVSTQDFNLWIATQPPEVQQTYANTWNANELGGIVSGFKNWQQTANARAAKSKQRLEAALTPDSTASKVVHAPSSQDEFLAGFNSVRGQTYR